MFNKLRDRAKEKLPTKITDPGTSLTPKITTNLDTNKMVSDADYEVKARDYINNYGSKYGITDDMIGWYRNDPGTNGMITLGGDDLIAPGRLENDRSWVSNNALREAIDNYAKQRGLTDNTGQYDISNFGYEPQQKNYDLANYGNTDKYSAKIDSLLDSILNAPKFNYNPETDQSFQAYREQYGRAGDRALANTMSEASSMTGGRLNSWAVSAGNQAKANFDEQLMNIIPQLESAAYNRYQNGLQNQMNSLNMLQGMDNEMYRRMMDERSFDYSMDNDAYNRALGERDFAYGRDRDKLSDKRYNQEWDYNVGRDEVSDQRYQQEWDYGVERDRISDDQWRQQFEESVRNNKDASARGWANVNLSKKEFEYQKQKDAEAIKRAAEETNVEEDLFGEFYYQMYSGVIIDENGKVIKSDVTPEEWLKSESRYLPQDVVVKLEEIIRKNKSGGQTYTIIPN